MLQKNYAALMIVVINADDLYHSETTGPHGLGEIQPNVVFRASNTHFVPPQSNSFKLFLPHSLAEYFFFLGWLPKDKFPGKIIR